MTEINQHGAPTMASDLAEAQAEIIRLLRLQGILLNACNLAKATLKRVEPAHTHGPFSTVAGTIEILDQAISKAEGK
jgi:hypothetical protein